MKNVAIMLAVFGIFISSARGQGFINLNFESAQGLPGNPPVPDGVDVAATNAIPGWIAYNDGNALADINYVSNYFSGAATSVELEGGSLALSGEYSVGLYLGAQISQTGSVPANAESLEFEGEGPGPGGSFGATEFYVLLGGQSLSYSALSEGPDFILYGANIPSDMDGQIEALTFGLQIGGGDLLDNIVFSTSSVPEPGEGALIGVAAVLFGLWRRRGKGRAQN